MFAFFKRHFHKIISFFCAFIIAFSTFVYSVSISAFASPISAVIGVIGSVTEFISTVGSLVDGGYLSLKSPAEEYYVYWSEVAIYGNLTKQQFQDYWTFVGSYGQFPEYYETYPGLDKAYGAYVSTMNSSWNWGHFEAMVWNDDGSLKHTSDSEAGVGVDDNNNPYMYGSTLKDVYADYATRYMPMPTPDDYIWSYNSSTTSSRSGADGFWYFKPDVPVYTYTSGQLGNHGWSDFYVLPFWHESTSNSTYYGKYYYRVRYDNVDGTVTLYIDVYSMSDNSFIISKSTVWDIDDYKYLGFMFQRSFYGIRKYASYSDYVTDNGITKVTLSNYYTMLPVTNTGVSTTLNSLLQDSSFEPNLDTNDDWGAYVSNHPFELISNQTSLEWMNLPDNYIITINGDTIYDYTITNPDTGDSTSIYYYITNDYTFPTSDDPTDPTDPSDPSDPTNPVVPGDITVSGNIGVNGDINIKTDPIDININVNDGGSTSSDPDISLPTLEDLSSGAGDIGDLIDYYQDSGDKIGGLFSSFYAILPKGIALMIPCAVGVIIFLGLIKALH